MRPHRSEPGLRKQRLDAARREVRAVPGQVQVEPTRAADARLDAGQVRDADEQGAARDDPSRDSLEGPARILEMLEHVPERRCAQRRGRERGALYGLGGEVDA